MVNMRTECKLSYFAAAGGVQPNQQELVFNILKLQKNLENEPKGCIALYDSWVLLFDRIAPIRFFAIFYYIRCFQ